MRGDSSAVGKKDSTRAETGKATAAGLIEEALGDDAARGIARAEKEDAVTSLIHTRPLSERRSSRLDMQQADCGQRLLNCELACTGKGAAWRSMT